MIHRIQNKEHEINQCNMIKFFVLNFVYQSIFCPCLILPYYPLIAKEQLHKLLSNYHMCNQVKFSCKIPIATNCILDKNYQLCSELILRFQGLINILEYFPIQISIEEKIFILLRYIL